MYNAPYTDEQKEFIRQHCSEMTAAELVILFNETFHENRTKKGLQYFIRSIGLKCVCPENTWADGFTEEQKEFMLIHMDNNPMNCDIKNLRCIPKKYRAFLAHNDWWNAPPEIKEAALLWCELYYLLKEV